MALDPKKKLEDLEKDLNTTENEIVDKNKQKETLKKDISDLRKKVEEVNQILKAYGQDIQNFEDQKKEFEIYSDEYTKIILGALGGKKADIDTKISEFDIENNKMRKEVTSLEKKYNTSETNFETATNALKDAEKNFSSLRDLKNEITNRFKELKNLKDSIGKTNENAKRYFLISELNALLKETKPIVKKKEDLEGELYNKLEELGKEKDGLRDAEDARNAALKEYKTKKDEFDKLNRREEILKILS